MLKVLVVMNNFKFLLKISFGKPVLFFMLRQKTQKPFILRKTNTNIRKGMINKGNEESKEGHPVKIWRLLP